MKEISLIGSKGGLMGNSPWMFNQDISEFIIKSLIQVSFIKLLINDNYLYFIQKSIEVLKFIKILTFNVREDDLACIVETRSLSLEYLSFKKLKGVYEQFLASFPTTLQEDLKMLRGKERSELNIR